jgi:hypothetical protein
MKYDNLEQLNKLRKEGAITEEEYQKEKKKILNKTSSNNDLFGLEENIYCMLIHLSQLCGFVVPYAGMVVPIVLWLVNKDKNKAVDTHGKVVLNWIISLVIYSVISGILCFIIIGIPLLAALFICNVVFIIIGSIKAYNGEIWKYPFSIVFIK